MKCLNCSFENLDDSSFCQQCGANLTTGYDSVEDLYRTKKISSSTINDIVFLPKSQTGFFWKFAKGILLGVGVLTIGLIFLAFLVAESPSNSTNAPSLDTPRTVMPNDLFPLTLLELQEIDSEWVGSDLFITGIIKNSYFKTARNIRIRLDFYRDKNRSKMFDTRYITLPGVPAKGAYSFKEPVYLNDAEASFWYEAEIVSAE